MGSRTGLSPLIAVIILFGIAITAGVLISGWVTNFITRETSQVSFHCATSATYIIESAEYNKTGDSTLVVRVTNKNTVSLYGFGVELQNDTDIIAFGANVVATSPPLTPAQRLRQEQSAFLKVNMTGYEAMAEAATLLTVTNDACDGVSAKTNSISRFS